jgi:positive regulator of sigma E activity
MVFRSRGGKMKEHGKVIKIDRGEALVEIEPEGTCTKCASCNASGKRYTAIPAEKAASLKEGDLVEIEVSGKELVKVYLLLYALPLAVFTLSVLMCDLFKCSPPVSFGSAILATAAVYLVAGRTAKKYGAMNCKVSK